MERSGIIHQDLYFDFYIQTKIINIFIRKKKQLLTIKKDKMESTVFNGKKRIKSKKKLQKRRKKDLKFKLALVFVQLLMLNVVFY